MRSFLALTMARKVPHAVQEYFDSFRKPNDARPDLGDDWLGKMVSAMDDVSTLPVASQLLRERQLRFSASSWLELKNNRLQPAMDTGVLRRSEVKEMLAEMEEYGKAHVLLFKPTRGTRTDRLLARTRVEEVLAKLGLADTLDSAASSATPVKAKITHIRFDSTGALVVKALETKESYRHVDTFSLKGGREVRIAQRVRARRVKLARLHPGGLLEVRLGSTKAEPGARDDHVYSREAESFLRELRQLIPADSFEPAPLDVFKAKLWKRNKRGSNAKILVLSQNHSSDQGNTMALRAGSRAADASDDETLREASRAFLSRRGSSISNAKVLWLPQDAPERPARFVTVYTTVEIHEFYTRGATSRADYEHVFSDIRRLGKL